MVRSVDSQSSVSNQHLHDAALDLTTEPTGISDESLTRSWLASIPGNPSTYGGLTQDPGTYDRLRAFDGVFNVAPAAAQSSAVADIAYGDSGPRVIELQEALNLNEFDAGKADGIFGDKTKGALEDYQASRIKELENALANGPPPMARTILQNMLTSYRDEMRDGVAGEQTQSDLNIGNGPVPVPEPTPTPIVPPAPAGSLENGDSGPDVIRLQRSLEIAGHDVGAIDGSYGGNTDAAVQDFQQEQIDRLTRQIRQPQNEEARERKIAKRDSLQSEMDANVAGPETQSQLKRLTARVEGGEIDFSIYDPKGVLIDPNFSPVMADKIRAVLTDLIEQGHTPLVQQGYRSPEEQDRLFNQVPKVTGARAYESWHQYGVSADIVVAGPNGQPTWPENSPFWDDLGEAAVAQGLTWGGNWTSFKDRPHVEFTGDYSSTQASQLETLLKTEGIEAVWRELGLV